MEISKLAVSVDEAAQMLSISKPSMYQLLKREDCNISFRAGNRTLVSVSGLAAWIERQTQSDNAQ